VSASEARSRMEHMDW